MAKPRAFRLTNQAFTSKLRAFIGFLAFLTLFRGIFGRACSVPQLQWDCICNRQEGQGGPTKKGWCRAEIFTLMSCVELLAIFPYVEFHFYFELSHINCGFGLKSIKTAVHNYKFL